MFAGRGRDSQWHDYYVILGVPVTATPEEIARAYRRLARTTHPDTNLDNPEALERFEQLTAAREVLADPVARAAYDRMRSRRAGRAPTGDLGDARVIRNDPPGDVRRARNRGDEDPRRPTGGDDPIRSSHLDTELAKEA